MKFISLSFILVSIFQAHGFCPSTTTPRSTQLNAVSNDRRDFLVSLPIAAAVTLGIQQQPAYAASVDYKAVSQDIANLVKGDPDKGPTLVRLAWHSSGTYDKMKKDGGSGSGTIRFREELAHGGNAGLGSTAVKWLEPIHAKYDGLSYADLYTLAGGKIMLCCVQ